MDNEKVSVTKKLKKGETNMKRNMIIFLVAAFAMVASTASAASIKNTKHDFSSKGGIWAGSTDFQICQPCHTPHNAQVAELLWNHTPTTQVYTVYSSYAYQGFTVAATNGIDETSKKCLSCHDGSIALDAFGGNAGGTFITGSARIGDDILGADVNTDLSNDHPIGFGYAAVAGADTEIRALGVAPLDAGNLFTELTNQDIMGCYTCHDVHNTDTPAVGGSKLLRQTNVSSALCLTCHIK